MQISNEEKHYDRFRAIFFLFFSKLVLCKGGEREREREREMRISNDRQKNFGSFCGIIIYLFIFLVLYKDNL